uniref:Uncharacterized protein n=1 Tax=Rhizophora mucronata TaxID=61149 RepID=A0A2P2NVG6_RHIMU
MRIKQESLQSNTGSNNLCSQYPTL